MNFVDAVEMMRDSSWFSNMLLVRLRSWLRDLLLVSAGPVVTFPEAGPMKEHLYWRRVLRRIHGVDDEFQSLLAGVSVEFMKFVDLIKVLGELQGFLSIIIVGLGSGLGFLSGWRCHFLGSSRWLHRRAARSASCW